MWCGCDQAALEQRLQRTAWMWPTPSQLLQEMGADLKQLKKAVGIHVAHGKTGKTATVANLSVAPNYVSQKLNAAMAFPYEDAS